jgi:hypothetical protein
MGWIGSLPQKVRKNRIRLNKECLEEKGCGVTVGVKTVLQREAMKQAKAVLWILISLASLFMVC